MKNTVVCFETHWGKKSKIWMFCCCSAAEAAAGQQKKMYFFDILFLLQLEKQHVEPIKKNLRSAIFCHLTTAI